MNLSTRIIDASLFRFAIENSPLFHLFRKRHFERRLETLMEEDNGREKGVKEKRKGGRAFF